MKRLAILRHAKSSWAVAGHSDKERPLNAKGHRQLARLSGWMDETSFRVDRVLVSDAQRTLETLDDLTAALGDTPVEQAPGLYSGHLETYLDAIWGADEAIDSLLIIGHNPNCDELAHHLAKPNAGEADRLAVSHFQTATLAVMSCDCDAWSGVQKASCTLDTFLTPKDLS